MYKDLLTITYPNLKIGEQIHIDRNVNDWFMANRDIMVSITNDGEITGFAVSYLVSLVVVEPYLLGDIAYVKEPFRRGRSAYLLYHDVVNKAKAANLPLIAKAFVGSGNKDHVDKIQSKFGEPIFTEFLMNRKN